MKIVLHFLGYPKECSLEFPAKLDSRFLENDNEGDGKQGGWKCQMWVYSNRINSLQKDLTLNKIKINNKRKCNSSAFTLLTPFAREMTSGC